MNKIVTTVTAKMKIKVCVPLKMIQAIIEVQPWKMKLNLNKKRFVPVTL